MEQLSVNTDLEKNIQILHQMLPIEKSFDLLTRNVCLGNRPGYWLGINGFSQAELLEKVFGGLQAAKNPRDNDKEALQQYLAEGIGFVQCTLEESFEKLLDSLTCGNSLLFLQGFDQAVVMDTRSYPARGVQEPELEKMTRGARDGFVETLLTNCNLIRRRIRSKDLIFEITNVGTMSKTDVAIAYLQDKCDPELIKEIRKALANLKVTSLTMGSKSLEELLVKRHWWTPMPSLQMTERPDAASSYLAEGHALLIVDNTPMVLILPCTIFQFTQSSEDYYKNPIVGSYLKFIRFLCIPAAMLIMPVFLLITAYYPQLSASLRLLSTQGQDKGHLIFYVLTVEFFLALFQYSAALSSDKFSGSLSIIGGLLIGDLAVQLNWSSSEVLFYGAITLLATVSVSCVELSDALRIYRLFMILCTAFGGPTGFWISVALTALSILTTPTFGGYSYFWPLVPWNWAALKTLLFRAPTAKAQPSRVWRRRP